MCIDTHRYVCIDTPIHTESIHIGQYRYTSVSIFTRYIYFSKYLILFRQTYTVLDYFRYCFYEYLNKRGTVRTNENHGYVRTGAAKNQKAKFVRT